MSPRDVRGAPDGDSDEARPVESDGDDDGYEAPVGTLFLLMVYVMVLAGMWVTMYWLLVSR